MLLAETDPWILAGGGALLIGLLIRTVSSDVGWIRMNRELFMEAKTARKEREDERLACERERSEWRSERERIQSEWRAEVVSLETKVATLEGEVGILRRQMQGDRWLGIDPLSRSGREAE